MKLFKLILAILILTMNINSFAQTQTNDNLVLYKNWTTVNSASWNSFQWAVFRTKTKDFLGKYYYYVYFYSNSYSKYDNNYDGKFDEMKTKITNVGILMKIYDINNNETNAMHKFNNTIYCNRNFNYNVYKFTFWSYHTNVKFSLKCSNVTSY